MVRDGKNLLLSGGLNGVVKGISAALGLAVSALHGLCHGVSNFQVADDCTRVSACSWAYGTGLGSGDGVRVSPVTSYGALGKLHDSSLLSFPHS